MTPADARVELFVVLVSSDGLYSLSPAPADPPDGWTVVHGPAGLGTSMEYLNRHLVDPWPGTFFAA